MKSLRSMRSRLHSRSKDLDEYKRIGEGDDSAETSSSTTATKEATPPRPTIPRWRERAEPTHPPHRQTMIEAVTLELLMHKGCTRAEAADKARTKEQLGAMSKYVQAIVAALNLPNCCLVAMLVYIERACATGDFALNEQNWQPLVLAAFVIAAKLAFDEPVWNEDFSNALDISNVSVVQISQWEVNFLNLIGFNTHIELQEYAQIVFRLQKRFQSEARGRAEDFPSVWPDGPPVVDAYCQCWVKTDATAPYAIMDASASWLALWQYTRDEAVGKPVNMLNGECTDRAASRKGVETFLSEGYSKMCCVNTKKDGSLVSHDIELTSLGDGILGISNNIRAPGVLAA